MKKAVIIDLKEFTEIETNIKFLREKYRKKIDKHFKDNNFDKEFEDLNETYRILNFLQNSLDN